MTFGTPIALLGLLVIPAIVVLLIVGERRQVAADLAAARASHVVLSTRGDWLRVLAAHLGKRR